jgi:hypothetical protein
VLLPAVLGLLGPTTWCLPHRLDTSLPHVNIEGAPLARFPRWRFRTSARPQNRNPRRHTPERTVMSSGHVAVRAGGKLVITVSIGG